MINLLSDAGMLVLSLLVLIYPIALKFFIFMTIASIIHYARILMRKPQKQMSKKRANRLAKGLPEARRKQIKKIK